MNIMMKTAIAIATSLALLAGCGGATEADRSASHVTPVASAASGPATPSASGRRMGRETCRRASTRKVLTTYLAHARRTRVADTAGTRAALVAQATTLPVSARGALSTAPLAAALFAVSTSKAQRSGAYLGCLSVLRKEKSR